MKYFVLLSLFFLTLNVNAQDTITAGQAVDYMDMLMFVKGKVISVKKAEGEKTTNYINLERPYPDGVFSIVISNNYLQKLGIKLEDLNQKTIAVKGKITTYIKDPKKVPQIFNPDSLVVLK